jgi:hypothetical protein
MTARQNSRATLIVVASREPEPPKAMSYSLTVR